MMKLYVKTINSNVKVILALLFFFTLSFIIYHRVFAGTFIWDDLTYIINNPIIQSKEAFFKIWFSTKFVDYWPLSYSLFRLEWLSFGLNTTGYHLINFFIHSLSCVLFWRILIRLNFSYSFFAAFVFCIHPVNVETVAWIFQAKTLLSAAFVLMTTLLYLRFLDGLRIQNYFAAFFCFVLANLSKASFITWPLVLLIYEWSKNKSQTKCYIFKKLFPFFLISLIFGVLNLWWYSRSPQISSLDLESNRTFFESFMNAGQVVALYIYNSLVPLGLCFVYPSLDTFFRPAIAWIPSVTIIFILAYLFVKKNNYSSKTFLFLLYLLISLFPVLGFFEIYFMKYSLMSDHCFYLSLLGIIVATITLFSKYIRSSSTRIIIGCFVSC